MANNIVTNAAAKRKIAKQVIASQTKVATAALAEMKTAVKANRLEEATDAAERLLAADAAVEAATKAAGIQMTDAQFKEFGYVSPSPKEGYGFIQLPIPISVCKIIVARDKAKRQ